MRLDLLGTPVDNVTFREATEIAARLVVRGRPACIVTPNPEFVVLARRYPPFRAALWNADLAIPDGGGLLLAARLLGHRLREQVRGTDLAFYLMQTAAARGWRVFLLGAGPGIAPAAATRLHSQYPALRVVGTFGGDASAAGDAETRGAVAAAGRVDVLLVAFGAPRQELWLARNLARHGELDVGVAVGVGGVLDFMAGRVRRAPRPVRDAGLEWLFRLAMQPWRWRRQLALVQFAGLTVRAAVTQRWRRGGR